MDKQSILLYAVLLLAGGGVSTGSSFLTGHQPHTHPEIIQEIREVEYEAEIFKLSVKLETMDEQGQGGTPSYIVAEAQLVKFTTMLTELGR